MGLLKAFVASRGKIELYAKVLFKALEKEMHQDTEEALEEV